MREMKKLVKIATSLTLMGNICKCKWCVCKYRCCPKSSPDIMIKFDDVTTDRWAYDEITNLVYHRIMYGYGNGKFGTEDNITREQAAAVLYRALGLKEVHLMRIHMEILVGNQQCSLTKFYT